MTNVAGVSNYLIGSQSVCDDAAGANGLRDELTAIGTRFVAAAGATESKQSLLAELARLLNDAIQTDGIAYVHRDAADPADGRLEGLSFPTSGLNADLQQNLLEWSNLCCAEQRVEVKWIPPNQALACIAAPVLIPQQPAETLLILHSLKSHSIETITLLAQLAAAQIQTWYEKQHSSRSASEARDTAAVLELLSRVEACSDLSLGCYTLVNELQRFLGCKQVVLGLCRRQNRGCQVRAISETTEFDAQSDQVRRIEAVLDESVARGTLSAWPPTEESDRHGLLAHKTLCSSSGAHSVVSSPIRDEQGNIQGAWCFLSDDLSDQENDQKTVSLNFIRAAELPVGSSLRLMQSAERSKLHHLLAVSIASLRNWKGRTALAASLLLAAVLALPFTYHVKCETELQPVARRFIAAPFDGKLDTSKVEPGDIVAAGALLARMDGREVRWELAGLVADFNRAAKERDGHLAKGDYGDAQLSKLEMERLDLKTQLLEHRTENLEIRSPIEGIVISGDLKKVEGMPLTVGQNLFEVAPLDEMIVEIAIPEADIAYVESGREVTIVLDAYPRKDWAGRLTRIHPRSEIREHEHVYIAELRLKNDFGLLRPGMRGRAEVVGPQRALAWNLFHKPWERLLFWLGW